MTKVFFKPTISVVIPVHNGGDKFEKCLKSVLDSTIAPLEVIVVADGDSDGSWKLAEKLGMQVLKLPISKGPARARNLGVKKAKGEVIFFTDADVAITPDTIGMVATAFQQDTNLIALFGSYDDKPLETNFLSQYRNMLHHYVHQTSSSKASTFWTGCGAIRRKVFLEIGGFNESMYRNPSIEDIELGFRLIKSGHSIRLIKEIQVKHMKHWDVFSMLKADFFYRALPWTDLLLQEKKLPNDLNLKTESRISVIVVNLLVISLLTGIFSPNILLFSILCMMALLGLNWDIYRFFMKKKGAGFTIKVLPWHWLYFFYSGVGFALGYTKYQIENQDCFK